MPEILSGGRERDVEASNESTQNHLILYFIVFLEGTVTNLAI